MTINIHLLQLFLSPIYFIIICVSNFALERDRCNGVVLEAIAGNGSILFEVLNLRYMYCKLNLPGYYYRQ
jgi:hypothetical protein